MSAAPITVLIADDDEDMRALVRGVLARADVEVVAEATDGQHALAELERLDPPPVPRVLVLDNRMPHMSGLEVAEWVLARRPEQPIVLFSAFLSPEIQRRAAELGVRACVSKSDVARLAGVVAEVAAS